MDAARRLAEARLALALLTRLPVGRLPDPAPPLAASAWAWPLAGLAAAILPALVFWAAPLPPLMAALLALAAGVVVTGGLHEDGLSDVADGFGGGPTRERKLEIMKDSRIGSYGALALALGLGLRATGLAAAPDACTGAAALLALGAASRAGLPAAMALLAPARPGGLGAAAAGIEPPAVWAALALGAAALLLTGHPLAVLAAMALAGAGMTLLARHQIGGFTGDTLGATQQAAEIAGWITLAALWAPAH